MSRIYKVTAPLVIMFVIAIFLIIASIFALPPEMQGFATDLPGWGTIMVSLAAVTGLINLLRLHGRWIKDRRPGQWPYSILLIFEIFLFMVVGFATGIGSPNWQWLYTYVWGPLQPIYMVVWFFSYVGAYFRVIRVRNTEAACLVVAAVLVMLGNAPVGGTIWSGIPDIRNWLVTMWASSGFRALNIGVAIGAVATSIRILMGIERRWLGVEVQ